MRHDQFLLRELKTLQTVIASLIAIALLTCGITTSARAQSGAIESARMITYQQEGQTFYAMSLMPQVEQKQTDASSIVVLFDTSASQQGAYRTAAMDSLQAMLGKLRPSDRVEIMAIDLSVKPMMESAAAPGSAELTAGMKNLAEQVPLGSTDLANGLQAAAERLKKSSAGQRTIVYIGDGVSVANVLDTATLMQVVDKLRAARTSVTSYAIGPKVDGQLLAVLANQTGGNFYVQTPIVWQDDEAGISDQRAQAENQRNAQIAGQQLAEWTRSTVWWPEQIEFATELGKTYPSVMPPLRSDRDSIVLGVTQDQLPASLSAKIRVGGVAGTTQLSWMAQPEASQEDHAFLAEIIGTAQADEGLSLPTVGSVGLLETARVVGARMDQLTRLAKRAIAAGDHQAAQRIAQAVLKADPGNVQARTVQFAVEQTSPANPQTLPTPAQAPAVAPANGDIVLSQPPGLLDQVVGGGEFLDQVEQERRVFIDMLKKRIQNTLVDARAQLSTNPQVAIQDLKLALESVLRIADLDAGSRSELASKLRSALKEANYQASLKADLDRQRQEQLAASQAQKLINEELTRKVEREKQLFNRFKALMDDRNYDAAIEVADFVEQLDPEGVTPRVATRTSRFLRNKELASATRLARHRGFHDTMFQIELASIPFSGEPPILYPDAETWSNLTRDREKWKSVDLSARSRAEEQIQAALRETLRTPLSYDNEQLNTILELLAEEYNIPIVFDEAALDEVAISPESEVSINLRNVSLRSALNLLLKKPGLEDLTYVIDDEVLLVTTEEKANETLKVKVYPVADLVLPIITPGIIGGGQQGGGGLGGGGQGGGGFGGGGQGGGGLGGGGQGGGGFFNVADDDQANATPKPESSTKSITKRSYAASSLTRDSLAAKSAVNWQARFAKETIDPAVVRKQAQQLMKSGQSGQVVELIQAALQHGQPQSWMYESLGIAMQLDGRPKSEIERAIMSASDFSETPGDLMLIAKYLSQLGLDSRAVEVYRQIIKVDPLQHDAYALGLRAAQRAKNLEGIRWATVGVLSHDFPRELQGISATARRVAKSILENLKKAGKTQEHDQYFQELEQALARDVIVKATWSGDADVDLIVEEPGGTVCSLHELRTSGGGVSLGDDYSTSKKDTEGSSELYTCAKGFPGTYRIRVRKVWGDVVANKVTIEVTKNFGTKNQRYEKQRITVTDDTDAMVIFELEESRREQPLAEQQLQVVVNRQDTVSQSVLAQQLADASDPRITPIRGPGGDIGLRERLALAGRGGAVGFQPVIQTFLDGTQLQTTGVVSADRRYVRISPAPSFTGIGEVQTFSFAGPPGGGVGGGGAGIGAGGGGGGI